MEYFKFIQKFLSIHSETLTYYIYLHELLTIQTTMNSVTSTKNTHYYNIVSKSKCVFHFISTEKCPTVDSVFGGGFVVCSFFLVVVVVFIEKKINKIKASTYRLRTSTF